MIRRLGIDDAEAYRVLRLEALLNKPEAFSSSYEDEVGQPMAFFVDRVSRMFGCFVGEALVGMAGLIVAAGTKTRHKGLIVSVYLRPAHRGHGLARQLMDFVIAEARGAGLAQVQLAVTVGNVPAERLYVGLGFQAYGVERDAIRVDGTRYDETLMSLNLL